MRAVIHLEGNSQSIPCPKLQSDFICTSKPLCYFSTLSCALWNLQTVYLFLSPPLYVLESIAGGMLMTSSKHSERFPGDRCQEISGATPPDQCSPFILCRHGTMTHTHTNPAKCHQGLLLKSDRWPPKKQRPVSHLEHFSIHLRQLRGHLRLSAPSMCTALMTLPKPTLNKPDIKRECSED